MEDLTKKDKEFLVMLTERKPQKRGRYFYYNLGNQHFKRSRVLMQIHLNKKLMIWEVVHHKDGNSLNDDLHNLEILDTSEHTSYHLGGKRRGVN